jgi:dGTPase
LEVAQIAKAIANRLNNTSRYFKGPEQTIDLDLVEFAALGHDLGHPPFGHIGEAALDELMQEAGGFEGNAQSLRIISKLEKKELSTLGRSDISASGGPIIVDGIDRRLGLNVTFRATASVLKYDSLIPESASFREAPGVQKGYYSVDTELVSEIRRRVLGNAAETQKANFKTIECSIMDVADDIAYSTYDLEDVLKSGLVDPMQILVRGEDESLMGEIAERVNEGLKKEYPTKDLAELEWSDCQFILLEVFRSMFMSTSSEARAIRQERKELARQVKDDPDSWGDPPEVIIEYWERYRRAAAIGETAEELANNGYARCRFTSSLIEQAVKSIYVVPSEIHPALHQVRLDVEEFKRVEVLKRLNFRLVISSPYLRMIEYRGRQIIRRIFAALTSEEGSRLTPVDFQVAFDGVAKAADKKRVVCDFIAGMTDWYALEFYDRLRSSSAATIYKPIG